MSRLTVVRVPRDQRAGFTVVSNEVVRPSGRLSVGALGLLAHLLSHAEGWDVSAERLTREFAGATLHTVKKLLRELEAAGHLERSRVNTASGFDHRWVVHEQPIGCHATDGLTIDGPTTAGKTAGIKKTTDKKTSDQETSRQEAGPAAPNRDGTDAIQALLDDHGGPHLDAEQVQLVLAAEHDVRQPVAWLRALADRGQLDGFVRSGALDPIDVVVTETASDRWAV